MFRSHRQITGGLVVALFSLVSLAGCGSGDTAERTRNGVVDTRTCAEGGECAVGDPGPGGGIVFYDAGTDQEWGRYLEVAPSGWANDFQNVSAHWKAKPLTGDNSRLEDPFGAFVGNGQYVAPNFSTAPASAGSGKSEWQIVKDFRCGFCVTDTIAELNQGDIADWYIPNKREMELLFQSKVRNLSTVAYWTSTKANAAYPPMVLWMRDNTTTDNWWASSQYPVASYRFVAIRAFAATPMAEPEVVAPETPSESSIEEEVPSVTESTSSVSALSQTEGVLQAVTNVSVTFDANNITISFGLQEQGLAPHGHFALMAWQSFGSNAMFYGSSQNSQSTPFPQFLRGQNVTVKVRSYSNATSPSQIADTDEITVKIPLLESDPEVASEAPPKVETEIPTISILQDPTISLPTEEIEEEVNTEEFVRNVENQLPNVEVEKIEVVIHNSSNPTEEKIVEVTKMDNPTIVIPTDATQVTTRITGTDGEVVEQTKLIVRVNKTGQEIAPTLDQSSEESTSTTVLDNAESVDTTVPSTEGVDSPSKESDNSSSNGIFVWIALAIVVAGATTIGIRRRN